MPCKIKGSTTHGPEEIKEVKVLMRSSICCKKKESEENGCRPHWGCLILLIFDAVQRRATDGPNFDWTITPPIRIYFFYFLFFQFTDIIGQGDAHCKWLCRYSEMLMFAPIRLNSAVLSIRGSQVSYEPVSPTFTTEVLSALAGKGGNIAWQRLFFSHSGCGNSYL